jgi:hypothetical protein
MFKFAAALAVAGALASAPLFAQSGTAAGLAGVGAGAALGAASGQGGTTPSSATGGAGGAGGSAPIEIQIMAFHGLQKIAADVADITAKQLAGCVTLDATEAKYQQLLRDIDLAENDRTRSDNKTDKLVNDLRRVVADWDIFSFEIQKYKELQLSIESSRADLASGNQNGEKVSSDIQALSAIKKTLEEKPKKYCAILIEDPPSSTQIAVYQAFLGYYDRLNSLQDDLRNDFPLAIAVPSLNFSTVHSLQTIQVTNINDNPISISSVDVEGADKKDFAAAIVGCANIPKNGQCAIDVTFSLPDDTPDEKAKTLTAELHITVVRSSGIDLEDVVQIKGEMTAQEAKSIFQGQQDARQKSLDDMHKQISQLNLKKKTKGLNDFDQGNLDRLQKKFADTQASYDFAQTTAAQVGLAAGGGASGTPPAGGGGGSATPVDLTYLSTIMTALGGIKSSNTYNPSSFQPTTQAFEVLVEKELFAKNILSYTSTSALDFGNAKSAMANEFGQMLSWSSQINAWSTQCKPVDTTKVPTVTTSACAQNDVATKLAVALQMITGYTTLLSTPNDGSGNSAIVDILRGRVLSDKMAGRIPSLQLAVVGAGGSTKTNSYFGVNLFYTFSPSYNAGVLASFELRDENNDLLDSGVRDAMFQYKRWKPSSAFTPAGIKDAGACGNDSFCTVTVK